MEFLGLLVVIPKAGIKPYVDISWLPTYKVFKLRDTVDALRLKEFNAYTQMDPYDQPKAFREYLRKHLTSKQIKTFGLQEIYDELEY